MSPAFGNTMNSGTSMPSSNLPTNGYAVSVRLSAKKGQKVFESTFHNGLQDFINTANIINNQKGAENLVHEFKKPAQATDSTIFLSLTLCAIIFPRQW